MTRPAYAQLVGQKFYPPKIFGQWRESEGSKEYKWRDTGMKIVRNRDVPNALNFYVLRLCQAVGFEMLYQENKGQSAVSEAATKESKVTS
jgi:hypothetical protein